MLPCRSRAWSSFVAIAFAVAVAAAEDPPVVEIPPDVATTRLLKALNEGDLQVIWDCLPARFQADLESLKDAFAEKMDAELWNKGIPVAGKIARVAKQKKEPMLASSVFKSGPAADRENLVNMWDPFCDFFAALAKSEMKTHEGLKRADITRVLIPIGNPALHRIVELMHQDPKAATISRLLRSVKLALVRQDGDTATLRVDVPGAEPQEDTVVKVDGKWCLKAMVDDWDSIIADGRKSIDAIEIAPEEKANILAMFQILDAAFSRLEVTQDRNQTGVGAQLTLLSLRLAPLIERMKSAPVR